MSAASLELLVMQNMVNSSDAIIARRRRILSEARRMISNEGPAALNMRELGKRAGVSTRTIYNAFNSRETVIALAIYTYFEQFISSIRFEAEPDGFDGALSRQFTSTLRDIEFPHYMQAVVELYFSPTLHADIRAVLHDIAIRSWVPWLNRIAADGQLLRGVSVAELLEDLADLQYSRILEWCKGGQDDETFIRRTMAGILTLLSGSTQGEAHERARDTFSRLQTDLAFRQQLLADARTRIANQKVGSGDQRRRAGTSAGLKVMP